MQGVVLGMSDASVPLCVIVGGYQCGKSTLVNCLLDGVYTPMGRGVATTRHNLRFSYGEREGAWVFPQAGEARELGSREELFAQEGSFSPGDVFCITAWKPLLQRVKLVDTPGFGECEEVDRIGNQALEEAELAILVMGSGKSLDETTRNYLRRLYDQGKKGMVLFNCTNEQRPSPQENEEICQVVSDELLEAGVADCLLPIEGKLVYPVNALWAWYALGYLQREAPRRARAIDRYWEEEGLDIAAGRDGILEASGVLKVRKTLENWLDFSVDHLVHNHSQELSAWISRWRKEIGKCLSHWE